LAAFFDEVRFFDDIRVDDIGIRAMTFLIDDPPASPETRCNFAGSEATEAKSSYEFLNHIYFLLRLL
jgi:hypothetical protein